MKNVNSNNPSVSQVLSKGYLVGRSENEINAVINKVNEYRISKYLDTFKKQTAVRSIWSLIASVDRLLKAGTACFVNGVLIVNMNLI